MGGLWSNLLPKAESALGSDQVLRALSSWGLKPSKRGDGNMPHCQTVLMGERWPLVSSLNSLVLADAVHLLNVTMVAHCDITMA